MSNALRSAGSAGVVCLNAELDGWLACTHTYPWLHMSVHLESEAFAPVLKHTNSISCTSPQRSLGVDLAPML